MFSRFVAKFCAVLLLAAGLFTGSPGAQSPPTESAPAESTEEGPRPRAVDAGPVVNQAGETVGRRSLRWQERVDLTLPYGWRPAQPVARVCKGPDYKARFYAASYSQGNAVYVEVLALDGHTFPKGTAFRAYFDSRPIPLRPASFGLRGFFPIGPRTKPGPRTVLFVTEAGPRTRRFSCPMSVTATQFPVYRSSMNLGKFSNAAAAQDPKAAALIRRSSARKRQVFVRRTPNAIRARMSHPRDMHKVTSPYFSTRIKKTYVILKNGKKRFLKPRVNVHRGLDLKGLTGAPIFALLDGTVAAAEMMYWEGNHTILDHGDGIFTVYMHQSELLVKAGQRVEAGDLIGRTGATGAVTGPHLHIALYMRGIPIQPLSFLSLPVRD